MLNKTDDMDVSRLRQGVGSETITLTDKTDYPQKGGTMQINRIADLLACYLDGHQDERDQWMVQAAHDLLHRETEGPLFVDPDTEAEDRQRTEDRVRGYLDY